MNSIKIKFNKTEGVLDLDSGNVYFYHFVYNNICTAIKNLEYDIKKHKKEIEILV